MNKAMWIVKIDGHDIPVGVHDLEITVFQCIPDLKYWSPEALLDIRNGLARIGIMMAEEDKRTASSSEKTKLTRLINQKKKMMEHTPFREYILSSIYETLLNQEGCGKLRGFGFCNRFKDPVRGNPEKDSVTRGDFF